MFQDDSRSKNLAILPRLNRGEGSLAMLSCYLDDSDNDRGPVLAIGGIIIANRFIDDMESELDACFERYGVQVLHAFELEGSKDAFRGWDGYRKYEFILEVFSIAKKYMAFGLAATVNKKDFRENVAPKQGNQNMSAIGFGFGRVASAISQKLLGKDYVFPVTFFIESGNKNSGNFVNYHKFLRESAVGHYFQEIIFVSKKDCKAVHLADFVAFYARRMAENWEKDDYRSGMSGFPAVNAMKSQIPIHIERVFGKGRILRSNPNDLETKIGDGTPSPFLLPGKKGV